MGFGIPVGMGIPWGTPWEWDKYSIKHGIGTQPGWEWE